jgi:hypothetical protein
MFASFFPLLAFIHPVTPLLDCIERDHAERLIAPPGVVRDMLLQKLELFLQSQYSFSIFADTHLDCSCGIIKASAGRTLALVHWHPQKRARFPSYTYYLPGAG